MASLLMKNHSTTPVSQDTHSHSIGAALTFIVILLGIGVPVWWNTTTVQRAYLPLEELSNMVTLAENDQRFHILFKTTEDASVLVKKLQNDLSESEELSSYNFSIVPYPLNPKEVNILLSQNSIDAIDVGFEELSENNLLDGLSIVQVPSHYLPSGKVYIGRHNFLYISEETNFKSFCSMLASILSTYNLYENSIANLPISNQYNVLLTFATSNLNMFLDYLLCLWKTPDNNSFMILENFAAFSKKFRHVSDLSISSQVVYIGNGHIGADYSTDNNAFILNEEKVVSLINILEPRLGNQLSSDPTFHWVLYVPHEEQSPMYIFKSSSPITTNSVLSPRWNGGGLQIVNGIEHSFAGLALCQLRNALGVFSLQNIEDSYVSLDYDESGVHAWELYLLTRRRTIQFLNQAMITLKSLSQLLEQIGNIVVSEEIKDLVVTSVKMVDAARRAIQNGNLQQAYRDAKVANVCAEKAFFDPSLLALLYFPEDQKYAIYIPLFLPIGIPVLLSLRSVYMHFLKR
ncbi:GPI transamidase component PIG-S isoform X1 [Daphnia magna]|uniref:GPI transamidase component PIG-S isoform X1 n=1 Tax=Daphnia magna TaxID=35525 RepID=UPI001E1BB26E|nr:GPI transamidase component PIG-S isoform X1 [Daphnia magna]XP_045029103.1 GPI transamidase component PIG-S isoform X1 [Daphnia magna]